MSPTSCCTATSDTLFYTQRSPFVNGYDALDIHSPGTVALAFDAANLMAGAARLGGVFDFGQAIDDLAGGQRWLAVAVVRYGQLSAGLARFFSALEHLGVTVVPSKRENVAGKLKAADDTALAAELVYAAATPGVTSVTVASGDGDLAHAISVARRLCRVTVAAFAGTMSQRLRAAADRTLTLSARHVVPWGNL